VGSWFGPGSLYGKGVNAALNIRGPIAPLAMGGLTGFLPCPLVYAFLAYALKSGSVLGAMGTMSILGLTSAPALILVALTGAKLRAQTRVKFIRVAGAVVLLLGVITLLRGMFPDLLHFGHQH